MNYISYNGKTKTITRHHSLKEAKDFLISNLGSASKNEIVDSFISKVIQTSNIVPSGEPDEFGITKYTFNILNENNITDGTDEWFSQCIVKKSGSMRTASDVFDNYKEWCSDKHYYPVTIRGLSDFLRTKGVPRHRTAYNRVWLGIDITSTHEKNQSILNLGKWFDSCIDVKQSTGDYVPRETVARVYNNYTEWCTRTKIKHVSKNELSKFMMSKGIQKSNISNTKVWTRISIIPE